MSDEQAIEGEVIEEGTDLVPVSSEKVTVRSFRRDLNATAKIGEAILKTESKLASQYLEFAAHINSVWSSANKLDRQERKSGDSDGEQRKQEVRERLSFLVGTEDKSIISKWVNIGKQADVLMPHAETLPPTRDALYALSVAAKKTQPIEKWVEENKISTASSVRDIRDLTNAGLPKKKAAKKKVVSGVRASIGFNGSNTEVAKLLAPLLKSNLMESISVDKALHHAIMEVMGRDGFESIKDKLN